MLFCLDMVPNKLLLLKIAPVFPSTLCIGLCIERSNDLGFLKPKPPFWDPPPENEEEVLRLLLFLSNPGTAIEILGVGEGIELIDWDWGCVGEDCECECECAAGSNPLSSSNTEGNFTKGAGGEVREGDEVGEEELDRVRV